MASQYSFRNRVYAGRQVYVFESATITVVDSTTTHLVMDMPPGLYVMSFVVRAVGVSDNTITATMLPYGDATQADVAGAWYVAYPPAAPAAFIATTAGAGTVSMYGHPTGTTGSNMALSTPLPVQYGCRVTTVTNAGAGAAVGTYTITALAIEV
jgi:hypothetical protein